MGAVMQPNNQENVTVSDSSSSISPEQSSVKPMTYMLITEAVLSVILVLGWLALLLSHTAVPDAYQVLTGTIAGHTVGVNLGGR